MKPDETQLHMVTERLARSGIAYALGGSGLLYSLGLGQTVRDWDLMTEAPKEAVIAALAELPIEEITSGDYPYASRYKLLIHQEAIQVELFGSFAMHTEAGLCQLPTIVGASWHGVQVSSPEVWYVAYALMQRTEKAELLLAYLREHGVRQDVICQLLALPLPAAIARVLGELTSWIPSDKSRPCDEANSRNR